MARIRVRRNFTGRDLLREIRVSEQTMREAGRRIADDIKAQTARGVDADGRVFAKTNDGSVPDLSESGQMIDDFGVLSADETGVRVGFRTERSARIAAFHEEGTSRMPRRSFVGVTAATLDRVVRFLKARMGGKR